MGWEKNCEEQGGIASTDMSSSGLMYPFNQTNPPRRTLLRWLGIFSRCTRNQCSYHSKRTEVTLRRIGTVGIQSCIQATVSIVLQGPSFYAGDDEESATSSEMYAFESSILVGSLSSAAWQVQDCMSFVSKQVSYTLVSNKYHQLHPSK